MKLATLALFAALATGLHAQTYILPAQSNGIVGGITPQNYTQTIAQNPVGAASQVTVRNLFEPSATVEFDYLPGLSYGSLKQSPSVAYGTVCTALGCATEPVSVSAIFECGSYTVTLNWTYTYSVMSVSRWVKRLAFEAHGTIVVE